jgi:membrane protein DedA with SNARE-associated domain
MIIEGPITTYIAAFASSIGYFNPTVIFLFSFLGAIGIDLSYYWLGRLTKKPVLYHLFSRLRVSRKKIASIEKGLRNHSGKMMVFVKVIPGIPPVGLTVAGMVLPFRRFLFLSVLISLAYSVSLFSLGYFSGAAYNLILPYFKAGEIIISVLVAIFIGGWFFIRYWLKGRIKTPF